MTDSDKADIPTRVRQVRRALLAAYDQLIDMADFESNSEEAREQSLLSRSLAALAVRIVTGCDASAAAAAVIDGRDDQGIDAIVVTRSPAHVYLVQAKWSDRGKATVKTEPIHKMLAGLRLIDSEESSQFNARGEVLAQEAKTLMSEHAAGVTLVIASMGTEPPSPDVEKVLENGEQEFNKHGNFLDHRVIKAAELWDQIRLDIAPNPVNMTVTMDPWLNISVPHQAYQGVVPVEEVASWLSNYGSQLFDLNIRNPLGRTLTNNELIDTLVDEPYNFWYFNNGITVLCDSLAPAYKSMRAPHTGPVTLTVSNASIVNGAQTVNAISEAMAKDDVADDVASALVSVRVIATGGASDFAGRTTKATNRQNRVESRDFITLDPVQSAIRADLKAELDKVYTVKRGELDPAPDTGCSIAEAAVALACAHPNAEYAARTAKSVDLLWERGAKGAYDILFRPQPGTFQIWNSVLTLRKVREELHALRSSLEGRAAAAVEHGVFLACHLTFKILGTEGIDDPEDSWATESLPKIPEIISALVPRLILAMDELYEKTQVRTICADTDRCKAVAAMVLDHALGEGSPTLLPEKYRQDAGRRKPRRPNAVPTIVNHEALAEGTPLTLYTPMAPERAALRSWLAEDPRRSRASWVNDRSRPILWEADGKRYSPTGLIKRMWELASWENRPVANQGTARWKTPENETLTELASKILDAAEELEETLEEAHMSRGT